MSRFAKLVPASWNLAAEQIEVVDTKAMGDAIEALESQVKAIAAHANDRHTMVVGQAQSIAADLSRLEQRTALPPKAEERAEGEYLVRWTERGARVVAWFFFGIWREEVSWRSWSAREDEPHWIGPRVDMREG